MEISFLRGSASHRDIDGSRNSTSYLRCVIGWAFSLFCRMLILGSLAATCAFAQTAQISGTITDSSGAVVPKATVTTLNNNTGITRPTESNSEGYYMVPLLQPGNYMITVEASGFVTQVRTGIILDVGSQQVLNVTLQVGEITQRIEVTGAAPAIELASSSVGGVVSQAVVNDIPLNGRDWTQLAALEPGVNMLVDQQPSNSTTGRLMRGQGQEMTISGTRPQSNDYRLDGISIVDYVDGSPGSILGVALGVDAVAEFSVITANQSAEYGRTSGGVINAITKSGTNGFHGDAYEFLRNSALDARQFFDSTIPPFRRNQFGASAGGPIQKDKTFFFADYEGVRQALGVTNVNKVPSVDARNGILHNSDGTTTTVIVDPLVKPYLQFWPLPNAGLIGAGNTGLFDVATNNISRENFATTRIDRKFSEKDSISGTWLWDSGSINSGDPLNNAVNNVGTSRDTISLEETHVFSPSLINSVRGGYSRVTGTPTTTVQTINPLIGDTSLGVFPGQTAPAISVSGLTGFQGGLNDLSNLAVWWNSFQAYDDAFLTKGNHSLKFGFAFERMQTNVFSATEPDGSFNFGSLEAFLTNQPQSFKGTAPGASPPHGIRQSLIGGYLQDDWRLRRNLTLNLGLRYEMVTVPTEVKDRLSNLLTFTSPTPHLGSPYFKNPTLRNFEPRIGFAWDPSGNGKTAVRGGFGIFDVLPLEYEFFNGQTQAAPSVQTLTGSNLAPGSFPTAAVTTLEAGGTPPSTSLLFMSTSTFNPPRNYVMLWNLNVEHQLTPSITAMVGYVGNHGVHMLNRDDDVNMVIPTATPLGYMWPTPVGSGTVLNPNVGDIKGEFWGGDSEYDALEVQLTKRISHGLQVQGSYTWGKSIDTGSSSIVGDPFSNSISSLLWFCNSCRRGLSDFNMAQSLKVNYIWDVPTPKTWGVIGSHVLGGWEVGGVITAETGIPFTPLIGGDPLGLNSNDPFAYPNRLSGPGCGSVVNPGNVQNYLKLNCFSLPTVPVADAALCNPNSWPGAVTSAPSGQVYCQNLFGNVGRNTVVGPGLVTFDFSLFKNNYIKSISESFNVQFRAEFFNILNRPNFAAPVDNSTLFDDTGNAVGGAGAIDQTSTTAREIQFALKLIW